MSQWISPGTITLLIEKAKTQTKSQQIKSNLVLGERCEYS